MATIRSSARAHGIKTLAKNFYGVFLRSIKICSKTAQFCEKPRGLRLKQLF
jgi:hypothetical protein